MTDHNNTHGIYTDGGGRGGVLTFVLLGAVAVVLLTLLLFSGGGSEGVEVIPGAEVIEQNGTVNVPAPTTAPASE